MGPSFSVVIPTYRRAAMLRLVLPSYLANGPDAVVVVDDGSGPPHDAILSELATDYGIRLVTPGNHVGLPTARNLGVNEVASDWVVFGEDDCWYPPHYASKLIDHALEAGAVAASGSARYVDRSLLEGAPEALQEAILRGELELHPPAELLRTELPTEALANGDLVTPMLTAGAAIRRSVFDGIRFDPRFRGNAFREETDFYLMCFEAGLRTVRCAHASCGHLTSHREVGGGAWAMGRAQYGWHMLANNWRFVRKHRALFRRLRHATGRRGGPLRLQSEFIVDAMRRARSGAAPASPAAASRGAGG